MACGDGVEGATSKEETEERELAELNTETIAKARIPER